MELDVFRKLYGGKSSSPSISSTTPLRQTSLSDIDSSLLHYNHKYFDRYYDFKRPDFMGLNVSTLPDLYLPRPIPMPVPIRIPRYRSQSLNFRDFNHYKYDNNFESKSVPIFSRNSFNGDFKRPLIQSTASSSVVFEDVKNNYKTEYPLKLPSSSYSSSSSTESTSYSQQSHKLIGVVAPSTTRYEAKSLSIDLDSFDKKEETKEKKKKRERCVGGRECCDCYGCWYLWPFMLGGLFLLLLVIVAVTVGIVFTTETIYVTTQSTILSTITTTSTTTTTTTPCIPSTNPGQGVGPGNGC